jgi:hypothetical protein
VSDSQMRQVQAGTMRVGARTQRGRNVKPEDSKRRSQSETIGHESWMIEIDSVEDNPKKKLKAWRCLRTRT